MKGLNKVILIGTLGKDPEVRYSQAGACFTAMSMATNEKWKDKNGEIQERTEWHRVKAFGKLAEIIAEYLKKGSTCCIEGKLRTEKYTDKEGVEKYSTDIIADQMVMLGGGDRGDREEREEGARGGRSTGNTGRSSGRSAPSREEPPARREAPRQQSMDDFPDDDIPF